MYPGTAFQTLLLPIRAIPFLLRDSCPQYLIKWSSEINSPIFVHFSSLIPKMSIISLTISFLLDHVQFALVYGPNISGSYAILFFTVSDFTFTSRHCHNSVPFLLWPSCFILPRAFSNCVPISPSSMLDTFQPGGAHISVSYLFAFSYHSRGSHGKNTRMVYHPLFQWTAFCQNAPL